MSTVINPTGNTGSRVGTILSTGSAPELYDLQKRMIEKNAALKSVADQYSNALFALYKKDPFNGDGEFKTLTEFDVETYASEQPEGTTAKAIQFGIGRTFNFSYTDYGVQFTATNRALMNANRHRDLISSITNLTKTLHERRYLDGVHRLTFGVAASFVNRDGRTVATTGVDGLSIFNSAHTLPFSTTTFSNLVPSNAVLGKAGILAGQNMFKTQVFNLFGEQKRITPNTLIITDDATAQYNARQIYGSSTEVGQSNANVINALNPLKIVVLAMLDSDGNGNYDSSKKDAWIMGRFGGMDGVDMRYCERYGIQTFPTIQSNDTSRTTIWSAGTGYEFVILSGVGMVWSLGTGTGY
jgi:hypothetical protein